MWKKVGKRKRTASESFMPSEDRAQQHLCGGENLGTGNHVRMVSCHSNATQMWWWRYESPYVRHPLRVPPSFSDSSSIFETCGMCPAYSKLACDRVLLAARSFQWLPTGFRASVRQLSKRPMSDGAKLSLYPQELLHRAFLRSVTVPACLRSTCTPVSAGARQ